MDLFFTNVAYASVDSFILNVNRLILNPIINLLFALALAFFFWGVAQFILNQDNETKKTEGKNHMVWGIIGLVIMFSVWGLLRIVVDTIGVEGIDPQAGTVQLNDYTPPSYPGPGSN